MKTFPTYPGGPPAYRDHPGTLLSASELAAANREYLARAEETAYYYDHAKLRGNVARCWFFAQAALLLERQRGLFFAKQDALQTMRTLQALKVAA